MPKLSRSKDPIFVAVNVATSWLSHVGIPNQRLARDRILSAGKQVVFYDGAPSGEADIFLNSREMASPDLDTSLAAFWQLTEAAGRGRPRPVRAAVERGAQDDSLSRALRLTEFQQAPPLKPEDMAFYDPVVRGTLSKWYRRNRTSLEVAGITREDLLNAGILWATNFHHRYRRVDEPEVGLKFLGRYCQQRCAQLARYSGFFHTKNQAAAPSAIIYTDSIESFDVGAEDEPTAEEITAELRDRLSYLRPAEARQKIEAAIALHPNLAKAGQRLLTSLGA